ALSQRLVERQRVGFTRSGRREISDEQPLSAEIVCQALRSGVGEHASDLLLEDRGVLERASRRRVEQLVVGNAAPEEERQARRQFEVRDPIDACRGTRRGARVRFDAVQELRAHQKAPEGELDAGVERTALFASLLIEVKQDLHVFGCDRTAIRTSRQRGQDGLRAARSLRRAGRRSDEHSTAARRIAGARWLVRTDDGYTGYAWQDANRAAGARWRVRVLERLADLFDEVEGPSQKRHAHFV